MIGLDSYSRQVFIYLDPILIYISLCTPVGRASDSMMAPTQSYLF